MRDYLFALSGGIVIDVRPSGPVFGSLPSRRAADQALLAPALSPRARRILAFLSAGWLLTFCVFVAWWVLPSHRLTWFGFLINSGLLLAVLLLSVYFLRIVNRMRFVGADLPLPSGRIAMVVTKAPSEPWPLVRTTLRAMLDQNFPAPYDVWLADEDPSVETLTWCREHRVYVSSRRGDDRYQRVTWPRRRRCKEGNLAYFYDHYGYQSYDIVSQLDADHVPGRSYLREIVRPFIDPAVGYVAAPSICDANAEQSWTVRGRPHEEAAFHGAQQIGLNADGTPVCIGSHYAVRTAALRQIGGLGPELAEDFTTSYLLNVAGWRGAFAIYASAHGDGPTDFAAMVTQEFQWARSLTTVFFTLVPRTCRALPFTLAARFLLQSGVYVLLTFMAVLGPASFAIADVTRSRWVSVDIVWFFALWGAMTSWLLAVTVLLRQTGVTRPLDAPTISWERMLYVGSRWPFTVMGVVSATIDRFLPRTLDFKVTAKGGLGPQPLPVKLILPFCLMSFTMAACARVGIGSREVVGYVGLSLLAAASQSVFAVVICVLHAGDVARHAANTRLAAVRSVWGPLLISLATTAFVGLVTAAYIPELMEVL